MLYTKVGDKFMIEKSLVSVIVPVYNCERYIKRCLNSIINQTYKNIEVIVIDDGSTDNSREIIHESIIGDDRFSLFSKVNTGASDTRNFGLSNSKGEYIVFVDADDWINPNMIKNNVEFMTKKNVDMVINDFYYDYPSQVTVSKTFNENEGILQVGDVKKQLICSSTLNSQCISMYSNRIIKDKKILFPKNIKYGEDKLFNMCYVDFINSAYYTNKAYYHYEIHNNSGCRKIHDSHLVMYDKEIKKVIYYKDKWGIRSTSEDNCFYSLIATDYAAFTLLFASKIKYPDFTKWMERMLVNTSFVSLFQYKRNIIYRLIPKTYRFIVYCFLNNHYILCFVYCLIVNKYIGRK